MSGDAPPPDRPAGGGASSLAAALVLAAALLAVNAGLVSARFGFVHRPKAVAETDHWRYLDMARTFAHGQRWKPEAPFCWRVLTPGLAAAQMRAGVDENVAFWLITNASLLGLLLAAYAWLRTCGADAAPALLMTAVVGLTPGAVLWFEYQYWMTDPPALAFANGLHPTSGAAALSYATVYPLAMFLRIMSPQLLAVLFWTL